MFKKYRTFKNRKHKNVGAACVEFAIVSPIFFLIVLASIEFARAHMTQSATENACFEGARRGIVPGATSEACEATTARLLGIAGLGDFTVEVEPRTIDDTTETVTVRAIIPITAENNFGISAFFRGRSIVNEISLPRQIR